MTTPTLALLQDRGVVSVSGEDARALLQNIVTNDVDLIDQQSSVFAGLLSPQGKILFDFLIVEDGSGGVLLDVPAGQVESLVRRLTLYRLRARAEIADVSPDYMVAAAWGAQRPGPEQAVCFADPRHPDLGYRWLVPVSHAHDVEVAVARLAEATAAYHAHRIGLGVPEGGRDYDFGDAFPHEADFDLVNGVSFSKGCYVGQEIVARMQHRGTVRKRVVRVTGAAALLPDRADVMMGDVVIGRMGSVAGRQGLALVRLDRAVEALDKGIAIATEGIALEIDPDAIARQRKLMAKKAEKGAAPWG